jgi:transposase
VREYVAKSMLQRREMFVPLSHRPGHAQADFGEADGYIGGKKVRFHYFCMDLPHSDGCFIKAYPAETAEAFCDGHVAAFDFFCGVPRSILYDNLWTPPAQGDLLPSAGVGCANLSGLLVERSRPGP